MVQSRAYPVAPGLCSTLAHDVRNRRVEEAMATIYRASYVSLHVRKSNRAALALYKDTLGFTVQNIEKGYCEWPRETDTLCLLTRFYSDADGEDAYAMRLSLKHLAR